MIENSVTEAMLIPGRGTYELRDEHGNLKQSGTFTNKLTDIGDAFYAERAAGIGSPPGQVTGMKLGTGTTAPSKSGAGAAIVTYTGSSTCSKPIDGTFPTSTRNAGAGTVITFRTTWNAGESTVNALAEVVITNESGPADDAGNAGNTVARALLSPTVNKGPTDVLAITWTHTLLGA